MITIPAIPLDLIVDQVEAVLNTFWPILAMVLGVALGSFVFRRIRGALVRRV